MHGVGPDIVSAAANSKQNMVSKHGTPSFPQSVMIVSRPIILLVYM